MTVAVSPSRPKGWLLLGNMPDFRHDPLGFLERCARDHGDFVPLRFVNRRVCLLNAPEQIEYVLATNHRNFRKTLGYRTPFMQRLFGKSHLVYKYQCACPACRHKFQLPNGNLGKTTVCPSCKRNLQVNRVPRVAREQV